MHGGFGLFLFVIYFFSIIQISQGYYPRNVRKYGDIPSYDDDDDDDDSFLDSLLISSTRTEPSVFFQNEPVPLASSVVDDLTTLASAVYIISFIIVIFILLVWITHYNAPCSSLITSILSTITGLPEPIIHSVALCGSCCVWCETTWLFRRIHHFNIWMSSRIKQFVSGTCKVLYDTICPCCRPPDTPSNRSIIGSLPASIIAMISVPDPSPPKSSVTVLEPASVSPGSLAVHLHSSSGRKTEFLVENQDSATSSVTSLETEIDTYPINEAKLTRKKRHKRLRKLTQPKQQSVFSELSQITDESHHEFSID